MSTQRIVSILQPGYLPWLGFFEQMHRADVFVYYDDVQYDKGGWRNRNRIKTPQGPLWLTVPVNVGLHDHLLDVQIARNTRWSDKHIKTIRQYYAAAPHFSTYAEPLFDLLRREWDRLLELDIALIEWFREALGIRTEIRRSSELEADGDQIGRLINIIRELDGTVFYEGAAGRNYISSCDFERAGIELVYQDYQHPIYPQCHGTFVSHLSILDLLMNCGPSSLGVLSTKGSA